jgi:hypothetical protein
VSDPVSSDESQRDRIIQTLAAETSELRRDGIALVANFLLDQPVQDVIDLFVVRDIVMRALTAENLARIATHHLKPGWQRYSQHASGSEHRIGELVPDDARPKIERLITKTKPPKLRWVRRAVDPALVRKLFAPVFADVLATFVRRLPIPGVSGAETSPGEASRESRGFAERLTRGVQRRTEKLVEASRQAMGGLGAELERRLQTAARDFGQSAMELFAEALQDRVKSREGRQLLQQISEQAVRRILETSLGEVQKDADALPINEILDLVPEIVAHAAPHGFVQRVVDKELSAFLSVEGERTLRELLTELGILDEARRTFETRADALARKLLVSGGFADWLARALAI